MQTAFSAALRSPRPVAGRSGRRIANENTHCLPIPRGPVQARRQRLLARSGDDRQQFFADRDRLANQQLTSLKAAAQEYMDSVLGQLREKAAGGGGGGGAPGQVDTRQLRTKIEHAITVMQEGLVERDAEVRLLVLAALAGEHVLFIGPPGTAKSEVGRRLSALIDGTYFERLLTRFSVPE
ncbi:ATPase [Raphidocelis subcapitata]|uniref:ATPase n=1 Tax=Raphidocelis subcapitata TaxID=307507 RepID=A0A2V0P0M2_9CHLO|nr:ATPase [Raphidocelis subcapitata]|eukprot:GBF91390.1 ATPase [Raphidocelis subcapitata]